MDGSSDDEWCDDLSNSLAWGLSEKKEGYVIALEEMFYNR